MKTIGILGGGQLGMMLAQAVVQYGGRVRVFGRQGAPASQTTPDYTAGDFSNAAALDEFCADCDAIVLEMEHIEIESLRGIDAPIFPPLSVLEVVQDRLKEKKFLEKSKLPHAAFKGIRSSSEVDQLDFDFPCISKTVFGGYDGLGQSFQASRDSLKTYIDGLPTEVAERGVVIEEIIELEAEVSCIVAIDQDGRPCSLPVIENVHRHHILEMSVLPARLPQSVVDIVREVAEATALALELKGILTVEFFVTRRPIQGLSIEVDGYFILVNEVAPRPHNSGHVTRKALALSQFEMLARVLMDIPLVESHALVTLPGHGFVMGNLLSDLWQGCEELNWSGLAQFPEILEVFLYGKTPDRSKRKMGHFLLQLDDISGAEERVRAVLSALSPN